MTRSLVHEPVHVVIPTRNRPTELRRCLDSLVRQTVTPDLVVVSDASESDSSETVCTDFSSAGVLPVVHLPCETAGTTVQRNHGLSALPNRLGFVLFLDDDVVLYGTYVERLLALMTRRLDVVGVAGGPARREAPIAPFYYRAYLSLFCLGSMRRHGAVLASGVNTPPPITGPPVEAEWLFGCAMYRSRLFQGLSFDESLTGYGLFDDVEFSSRARAFGTLVVDPGAHLDHLHSPRERLDARAYARVDVRNRHWFVRRHRPGIRSSLAYWWSILGLAILYAARALHHSDAVDADRCRGLLEGIIDVAIHR